MATLNSRYKSTHTHNSHYWQCTAQQTATTTVRKRTPATASPYLKRVGVKRETPTAEYYKAVETEKRLDHNSGQAKDVSHRTSGQTLGTHTLRDNEAHGTPERPCETRVSRRNTNIPDLHEVGKEQPGVTPRNTKQPSEKDVSLQARPPLTSTWSRAHKKNQPAPRTLHEVRELHLPMPPRTAPRNGLPKQQLGVYKRHPERTRRMETTKHGPRGQQTKPKVARHS
ncbi:hypothetical protein Taro_035318 [Colocasia esculenta]|uniref:Uncharacterized protein n=1 Tax=Colocasia esculenta TaxID=4460 RepID=A0A843WIA6_COLES|nr:hypothetical protein [Colocasia esculenta]